MPTNATNPQCSNKKLHIGNDFVTIVYNDSNRQYQFGTIKVIGTPLNVAVFKCYLGSV